jgi:Fe-S-cluster-containing dehydrogenase component
MMKCDMCYDRTSAHLKPMCASVCPSQALFFGTREEIDRLRPNSMPTNMDIFGQQIISTTVKMMSSSTTEPLDIMSAMFDSPESRQNMDDRVMESIDGLEA